VKPAARALRCDAAGHRLKSLTDGSFRLTQPQSTEQRPANPPVYDQAISAFKSRDRAAGSWSDDSIDCAVVITELAEAPLHGCDQRGVIAVSWRVVRVVVVVGAVRVTAPVRVWVIPPGRSVTPIGIRPARVVAVVRVSGSTAIVVARATVIRVIAIVSAGAAVITVTAIVSCAAVFGVRVIAGAAVACPRV